MGSFPGSPLAVSATFTVGQVQVILVAQVRLLAHGTS